MTRSLKVSRQYEDVRLTDEEDSPLFRVEFTDSAMRSWADLYTRLVEDLTDIGVDTTTQSGQLTEEQSEVLARVIKEFITALTSEDTYQEILAYVGGGQSAENCNLGMSDVFGALADLLSEKINARREAKYAVYRREQQSFVV
jgi:hypothetical protein